MSLWETDNEIVLLGEIFDSLPYEQKTVVHEKWGMDVSIGARPLLTLFPRSWRMPDNVLVEVYL